MTTTWSRLVLLLLVSMTPALASMASSAPVAGRAAASGLGELLLDPGAVAAILRAAMPGPRTVELPGVGELTFVLEAPEQVVFREGGIELRVRVRQVESGAHASIFLRYEPEFLPESGRVRLRAVRAEGEGMLALFPDLAEWMPAADIRRAFDWLVPDAEQPRTRMTLYVQDVKISEERFVVRFSLTAKDPL